MTQAPHLLTAFAAGVLSFLTPCVLPLVPGYISFISGQSLLELRAAENQRKTLAPVVLTSLSFILGFSAVFISLGAVATTLGRLLAEYKSVLSQVGGVIIIALGLHLLGVLRIGVLYREARFQTGTAAGGALRAFLLGLAFAFGWTPCVGPILGAILTLAVREESLAQGMRLLTAYSLGMAVPFFLTGLAVNRFFVLFERIKNHLHKIEIAAGVLLVLMGAVMLLGEFNSVKILFQRVVPEFFQRWG